MTDWVPYDGSFNPRFDQSEIERVRFRSGREMEVTPITVLRWDWRDVESDIVAVGMKEIGPRLRLLSSEPTVAEKYSHYHKRCRFEAVDVYRVLAMFEVSDPCIQHAVKKLLVAGQRGAKDTAKDISEAIATLQRWQQMRAEEEALAQLDVYV